MDNVLFRQEVLKYSENLIQLLYDQEYFGFKESAKKYVKELFDEITNSLPIRLHKPAPKYFEKYGKNMKYIIHYQQPRSCKTLIMTICTQHFKPTSHRS